jgi:hypothetical protein
MALRWSDLDFTRGLVRVEQATWRRVTDSPKDGRGRVVPMTQVLRAALHRHKHLRSELFFASTMAPLPLAICFGPSWRRLSVAQGSGSWTLCTSCVTRSARTWRCEELRRSPSRSSPATPTSRQRCVACTCRRGPWTRPSRFSIHSPIWFPNSQSETRPRPVFIGKYGRITIPFSSTGCRLVPLISARSRHNTRLEGRRDR